MFGILSTECGTSGPPPEGRINSGIAEVGIINHPSGRNIPSNRELWRKMRCEKNMSTYKRRIHTLIDVLPNKADNK